MAAGSQNGCMMGYSCSISGHPLENLIYFCTALGSVVLVGEIVITRNIMFLIPRQQVCINAMHRGIDPTAYQQ